MPVVSQSITRPRDHGRLGVAVAVLLAERQRLVPARLGPLRQRQRGAAEARERRMVERHRRDLQAFIAGGLAMRGDAVVADDAQHVLGVLLVAREGAELARHLRRGRIGDAGHHRGQAAGERPALVRIVAEAHGHQQAADIGVAEAERAVLIGELGDLAARELRHRHRDLEHDRPEPAEMLVTGDVEALGLTVVELQQVGRGQIAGGVVEEHVLRARIRGADASRGRAGVPVVHRGVEVQAGIGRGPGGVADLLPEVARLQGLGDLAGGAADEVPVAVGFHRAQEVVGQRDRVVRVLAGDGEIGLRIPVGVVGVELDLGVALLGELDDALDVVVGHHRLAGELDLALQRRVLLGIEAGVVGGLAIDAGLHHRLHRLLDGLGAGDQGGDLLLLLHLPVDIGLDVRMVGVDHHHLGGAAGGAARLDRAGGAVADLEEGHQAGGTAAAGELLALAAQHREVRAGAGAVFEQARLAHPQIHDAALVDEVVLHALDEAGMRLRMLVARLRLGELAGLEVDIEMALAGAVDAIGPVQAGVEPLRRVRRHHLARQHEAQFVVEGRGVRLRGEIAALPAPIGPAAGEPVEDLLGRDLGAVALGFRQLRQRLFVGDRTPEEGRDVVLLDLLENGGHAGLAEIFLREHVARDLRPGLGHLDAFEPEDDRTIGITDFAHRRAERDRLIGRLAGGGMAALDAHKRLPQCLPRAPWAPRAAGCSPAPDVSPTRFDAPGIPRRLCARRHDPDRGRPGRTSPFAAPLLARRGDRPRPFW
jgi:hypothetical protein